MWIDFGGKPSYFGMRNVVRNTFTSSAWLRTRALFRGLSVALFVTTSLIQLAGSAPELGVAHIRCAEHGELTHAPAPGNAAVAASRFAGSLMDSRAAFRGSSPASGGHEHCPFAAVLDQPAPTLSLTANLDGATLSPPLQATGWRRASLPSRRLVLDSAPKTSPPAA
ncbi:MAG: hypothetical protein ABUS79_06630 [Pseudomonadota bacterium]